MKKIKIKLYPFNTIILPLSLIGIIAIWLSSFFELVDYNGNGFLIKLSEITFNHPRKAACIILFLLLLGGIRWLNKDKEYAPTDIYGNYPIFVYYIAGLLLGYKTVNLKMKPIPLQFQLLDLSILKCFDDTEYSEKDFNYDISYYGTLDKGTKQINIIVADTYRIKKSDLPNSVKNNYTILINRNGERGIRIYSQKIIDIIIKEVQSCKTYCKNFNLFLTTPAATNKAIFEQAFHTGFRDNFIINIYRQDSKKNFKFNKKPVKIKC